MPLQMEPEHQLLLALWQFPMMQQAVDLGPLPRLCCYRDVLMAPTAPASRSRDTHSASNSKRG
ncbi:MAG TPA: hypothetical protein VH593_04660 [Ktedonobacteraceae bacterium]